MKKWLKSFYAKYSKEIEVTAAVLGMMAISLGLFYLIAADRSAVAASAITCIILVLAFLAAIIFIPDGAVDNDDKGVFCRMVLTGSALVIFPHAIVFALPLLATWQPAGNLIGITWLIFGLMAFAIGLAFTQGWVEKDHCNSQWAYLLAFSSFAISCGVLGKLAYGSWTAFWHACYGISFLGGRAIVWKTKLVKMTNGKNTVPNKAFYGFMRYWALSMLSAIFMINDATDIESPANTFLIYAAWLISMLLIWLVRMVSHRPSKAPVV